MKKLYEFKTVSKLLMLIMSFLLVANSFAQGLQMWPENNPKVIIRTQESTFIVRFVNTGTTIISGLWLESIPTSGFSVSPAFKEVPALAPNATVIVELKVKADCSAPQSGGWIKYNLYDDALKTNLLPLSIDKKSFDITITEADFLFLADPSYTAEMAGTTRPYSRVWAVVQTAPEAALTDVYVTNNCTRSSLDIFKMEIVDRDGNLLKDVTATHFNRSVTNKYYYTLNKEVFNLYGYGDYFRTYDTVFVRETFYLLNCINDIARYTLANGDGVTWCDNPNIYATHFNILPMTFTHAWREIQHVVPTSSDGTGFVRRQFINTSANLAAIMRDLQIRANRTGSFIPILTRVYFVDKDGNDLGLPNLLTNQSTNIDLPFGASFNSDYGITGLKEADMDGRWNDLFPNDTINIMYEYKYNFSTYVNCPTTFINSYHTYNVGYRDNCFGYIWTGDTWQPIARLGYNPPLNARLTPTYIQSGYQVTFSFTETDPTSHDGWPVSTSNYDHYVTITLPEGFDYDPNPPNNHTVSINSVVIASDKVTVSYPVIDGKTRTQLSIHITNFNPIPATMNYSIKMVALPGMSNHLEKKFTVEHEFGFISERPTRYRYSCSTTDVNYNGHPNTGCIAILPFNIQRMTFGYDKFNETSRTRIDLTNIGSYNVDRTVAGPWDNVDWTGGFQVQSCGGVYPNERWMVDITYKEPLATIPTTTPPSPTCFYFPDPDIAVEVKRVDVAGNFVGSWYIKQGDFVADFTDATSRIRTMRIDIRPYTIDAASCAALGVPVMADGDYVYLTYRTRTTERMPNIYSLVFDVIFKGFFEQRIIINPEDYIMDIKDFWVVDYAHLNLERTGPDWFENSFGPYTFSRSNCATALHTAEIFTNEFRPNQYAVEYEYKTRNKYNIYDGTTYELLLGEVGGSRTVNPIAASSLVVTQKTTTPFDSTIISFKTPNPLQTEFRTGVFFNTGAKFDIPCFSDDPFTGWVDFNVYPTSEYTNIIKRASQTSGNLFGNKYYYSYALSVPLPHISLVYPPGNEATWNFRLTNNSNWRTTDRVLPYSWLAIEMPLYVDHTSLVLTDGLGNTWSGSSFVWYETVGNVKKYWVQLGNLSIANLAGSTNPARDFSLYCEFASCKYISLKLTYGMSKYGYPLNPNTVFPGTCPLKTSITLDAQPVLNQLRGTVYSPYYTGYNGPFYNGTDGPNYDGDKGYTFCENHPFRAIFSNTQVSELNTLSFTINLSKGLELVDKKVIAIRDDDTPIEVISVDDAGPGASRTVTVTLHPDALVLPWGPPGSGSRIACLFDLKPGCGYTSGHVAYVDFYATNECGERLEETKNTIPILLDGIEYESTYSISYESFTNYGIEGELDLSGPVETDNAFIDIAAKVKLESMNQTSGDYIAISIPKNMIIDDYLIGADVLHNLPFILYDETVTNSIYFAKIPPMEFEEIIDIWVHLKPVNPENWVCDKVDVSLYTITFIPMICDEETCDVIAPGDNKKSKDFSVKKLNLSFASVDAVGTYHNSGSESVVFTGVLNFPESSFLANALIEVYSDRTGEMLPIPNAFFYVNDIMTATGQFTFPFTSPSLIIPVEEMCYLNLVINITSNDNQYLCNAGSIKVNPTYNFTGTYSICAEEDLVVGDLPLDGYTYTWSPIAYIVGGEGGNTGTPITVNYSSLAAGNNLLTCMVIRGTCAINASVDVFVYALPIVSIDGDVESICVGETAQLLPDEGGVWVSSDPTIAKVDEDGVVTALAPGTVTFTFTDENECSSTTGELEIVALPEIYLGKTSLCVDESTTLSSATSGDWTTTDNTVASFDAGTGLVTGLKAGEVTFTFTDAITGCSSTTEEITVYARTEVSITGKTTLCVYETTTLSPTTGGTWASNNLTVASVDPITGVVTPNTNGIATFTFTDATTQCTSTTGNVTIIARPPVSITGSATICIGETTQLSPASGGGTWVSSNTDVATVTISGQVTGVGAGTATFTYTTTAAPYCSNTTGAVTVTAKTIPTFSFPDEITYCAYDTPVTLPTTSNNGITGTWSSTAIAVPLTPGSQTTYTFTPNPNQCATGKTITVSVKEHVTAAEITVKNDTICVSESITFKARSLKANDLVFRWYVSQNATTPIWTGPNFPAGAFYADTAFYVGAYNSTYCETPRGERKKVSLTVVICKLLYCDIDMLNRRAEEDGFKTCKYKHEGTEWDVEVTWTGTLDSIEYYINDVKLDVPTLDQAVFPLGLSVVKVVAYYLDIVDVCQFTVFIDRACPPDVYDDEINKYNVTKLVGLCWTDNLKATKYALNLGGDPIPFAKPYETPLYPNTDYHFETFGLLYDWYSAVGSTAGDLVVQGICPEGWHIPSDAEWARLEPIPASDLNSKLYWVNPGKDKYGFDARPAGWYNGAIDQFVDLYGYAGWWSSTDPDLNWEAASHYTITYYCSIIYKDIHSKGNGLSVRCVWDGEGCIDDE